MLAQAGYLSVFYIAIIFLVSMDLWSGVRKARKRGEARMSFGYRRTLDKLARYINIMLAITAVDMIVLISPIYLALESLPAFPYLSLLAVIFIAIIEIKSMCEKAEDKQRFKSTSMLAGKVIASKDDISKMIEEIMSYMNTTDQQYIKDNEKPKEQ
ncbi:MAG: hypothetical protein A2X18_07755 [Bacteroidetes bacterium GWF2_40_14]|nr:MAG: hypothetical protein A2X18_07755 [Bacteroidetes bacterium GWF2_40_14]